jgi:hypothetical protein
MYFHQAMQQDDASEFVKAAVKEVNGHIEHNRWQLVQRNEIPEGIDPIPSVWSMRCKRNLTTNEGTKNKSRLNLHGGKQVFGMNYFETYAPSCDLVCHSDHGGSSCHGRVILKAD